MNQSDIFSGITAFVRAAEAHSFTHAARLMGLTPSAVSKSVSRLEKDLGVRLFNRSPRDVTLTTEGQSFFIRCKDLVHNMEDARALAEPASAVPQGLLRVCAPVTFGEYVLAPALAKFLSDHPSMRVEMVLTDRFPDMVEERFDVAIRIGEVPDSRLIAKQIYSKSFVTCASPSYLKKHGIPKTPDMLKTHNCLGYLLESSGTTRTWLYEKEKKRWSIQPQGSVKTGHASVLLKLALHDIGIIHTPHYLLTDALKENKLVKIFNDYNCTAPSLSAVYPKNRFGSNKIETFIRFLTSLPSTMD